MYACDNSLLVTTYIIKHLPLKPIPKNTVTLHTLFQSYSNYGHLFQFNPNEVPLPMTGGQLDSCFPSYISSTIAF